jgi:hypothetical protein
MKSYPKYLAVKQDFINLLEDKEFKKQALIELLAIYKLDDSKATKATTLIDPLDPEKGWNTEIIDNPMPMWKQKGFASRQAVADLITENGGEI